MLDIYLYSNNNDSFSACDYDRMKQIFLLLIFSERNCKVHAWDDLKIIFQAWVLFLGNRLKVKTLDLK